jgi:hypothetical protein
LAVVDGTVVGSEAEADGAEGSAVGCTLDAGASGDWEGVSLVPPALSPHATAAIDTNAAIIQIIFRMALPVVFDIQPI